MKHNNYWIIIFLIIFTIGCSQTFDPTDINERIDELAEKNEEQDGKIRNLEERVEKLERLLVDYSILTSKIQSLESQYTLFNSSISNLNQKYNDLSESIENLSSDNSLDEIESLQAEIEKLKVDISNIKNVIEVYAELRERITVLENNVSTSEEDIVKLKELILKFSEDIKDLEQQDIINNITWGDRSITLWNENKPQYSYRIDAVSYVEYDWTAGKTTYKKNGEYLPFDYDFTYYYVYIIPGGSQNTNRTWYKKDLSKCLLFNGSVSEYSFSTSLPYLPNKDSAFDEFLADFLSNIGE